MMLDSMRTSIAESFEELGVRDLPLDVIARRRQAAETLRWLDEFEGDVEDRDAREDLREFAGRLWSSVGAAEAAYDKRGKELDKINKRDPEANVEDLCERAAVLIKAGEKATRAELRDMVRNLADILAATHEWRSGLTQAIEAERDRTREFLDKLESLAGEVE